MTLTTDFPDAVARLTRATNNHLSTHAIELGGKLELRVQLLIDWLDFIENGRTTDVADELIVGVRASLVELVAAISLGLSRACLALLRSQIDMVLSWMFYKDHRQEWLSLNSSGREFMQHQGLLKYLKTYYPRFELRLGMLRKQAADPFSLLSQFMHCQQIDAMPPVREIEECINKNECDEVVTLQMQTTEYLNDVLLAFYADEYAQLPPRATVDLAKRLGANFSRFRETDPLGTV